MGGAQIKNGYTRIANELLEKIVYAGLNGLELSIILTIIRLTYGYHKTEDKISISQFQNATNASRSGVCKALNSLKEKRVISMVKKGAQNKVATTWKINKNDADWRLVNKRGLVHSNTLVTSPPQRTPLVHDRGPTKERLKKYKKKSSAKDSRTHKKLTRKQMEEIEYEYEDQPVPKKYKNKSKLYAKIAVSFMRRKGEEGDALRYFKDIKELVELTEKAIENDGMEVNEENVLASIEVRFKKADELWPDLDWGLNGLIKNFNRLMKAKQSR